MLPLAWTESPSSSRHGERGQRDVIGFRVRPVAAGHYVSRVTWLRLSLRLAIRTLRDPGLAPALVRVGWRFRRRDWFRRAPFLPIPDRNYLRWRMLTAYGDPNAVPPADDVARYAKWAVRG